LQAALGRLRSEKGFDAEVIIGDISLPRGGSFAPHVSHTSGRDVDIRLILAPGLDRTTLPLAAEQVDWDATWELVHGFLETGQVTYVFLDFAQQGHLYRAGERAGMHPRVLDRWFQWPDATKDDAIVRHEPGHRAHLHVRLGCDGQGPRCKGA
jgi:murein endopeptidase